jgi:uncharacterized protein (DUF4213/DUF364 family)
MLTSAKAKVKLHRDESWKEPTLSDSVLTDLLTSLPNAPVRSVTIGTHWTAVVVETAHGERCGLATSLSQEDDHHHGSGPAVKKAGHLHLEDGRSLAEMVFSSSPPEVSVGMAAINALLPRQEAAWVDLNAELVIAERGQGRNVALVGHFPFVPRLRDRVGRLSVLELAPRGDDLPAEAAPDVIPEADVVALTSLTLMNNTFDGLIKLCRPDATVLLLGPSTPLSPVLYDYGVKILSGSIVEKTEAVLDSVSQGANFRQVHRAGVRLVTMTRD